VNPATKICATLCGPEDNKIEEAISLDLPTEISGIKFNEPGGLCIDPQCEKLYIADTNNHKIKILTLATGDCTQVMKTLLMPYLHLTVLTSRNET